jgi:hypothetical protein
MRYDRSHERKGLVFDRDRIKAIADSETIAETLGMDVRRYGRRLSILCPDHPDTHHRSCFLTDGGYKCFACGSSGDLIQLVSHVRKCSFEDACAFIADIYGTAQDFMQAADVALSKRKMLDDESLRLIGLGKPHDGTCVYGYKYAVLDAIDVEDELQPNQRLRWVPVRNRQCSGYYIIEELLSSNPLRDLMLEDEPAYNALIARKAGEAAAQYREMIEMARSPMRYYGEGAGENFLKACYCEEVAEQVGFVNWEKVLLQKIRKCDNIRIEHSNGTEMLPAKPEAQSRRKSVFGKIKSSGVSF